MLVLRMAVGPVRRHRFDDACQRHFKKLRALLAQMRRRAPTAKAADAIPARREAEQVIERARQRRQDVDQEGNVIRPRAFDPSRKKPPLH